MIDAAIVLGSSPSSSWELGQFEVNGHVVVSGDSKDDPDFDLLRINCRGATVSAIGAVTKTESVREMIKPVSIEADMSQLINLTSIASRKNVQALAPTNLLTHKFHFDISTIQDLAEDDLKSQRRYLPPSMSVAGSKYITSHTATSDRYLLKGTCTVMYWIELHLLRAGNIIFHCRRPFDLSWDREDFLPCISPRQGVSYHMPVQVKNSIIGRIRRSSSSNSSIQMFCSNRMATTVLINTGARAVRIPVTVTFSLPGLTASLESHHPSQLSPLRCTTRARWHGQTTFNSGSACARSDHSKPTPLTTLLIESKDDPIKFETCFPPPYEEVNDAGSSFRKYTANVDLPIPVPELLSSPSISTKLLKRDYFLELDLLFTSESPHIAGKVSGHVPVLIDLF